MAEDDDDIFAALGMMKVDTSDAPTTAAPTTTTPAAAAGGGGFDGGDEDAASLLEAFRPGELLWDEVKAKLRPAEVQEVKAVLGSELVDNSAVRTQTNTPPFALAFLPRVLPLIGFPGVPPCVCF